MVFNLLSLTVDFLKQAIIARWPLVGLIVLRLLSQSRAPQPRGTIIDVIKRFS